MTDLRQRTKLLQIRINKVICKMKELSDTSLDKTIEKFQLKLWSVIRTLNSYSV
jgi:hypothetical protein